MSVKEAFIDTIVDTLRRRPLFEGHGPILEGYGTLQEPVKLGSGGDGFVVRGYVLVPDAEGAHRVQWLVVKAPLPVEPHPSSEVGLGGTPPLVVANGGVERELDQRVALGQVPGLGSVPIEVEWPVELVARKLPRWVQLAIELPPQKITLAVFKILDGHVAREPPWALARFVQGPVERAVDLKNWCEIARRSRTSRSSAASSARCAAASSRARGC